LRQLTRGAGPDESPSVARNGSIAFTNTLARCALIVHDFKNNRSQEILTHASALWAPAFSPDGHDLAFSRLEKDGAWHIWIVPVQGGSARRLTSGTLPEVYPRFTPDGAAIIYHTWSSEPGRIWRVPRAGGPAVPITPVSNQDDGYGDISPNGQWLAFAHTEGESTRIYVAPVNGGVPRRLTDSASTLPRWSPDGQWIAFSSNRGYNSGVFVIGADGTGERRLAATGGWPVWWPDGKRLGYLTIGPDGAQQILTMPFRGGVAEPVRAVQFNETNLPFDVSSDGKLLATSNCVEVSSEIWLLEPRQ
jgi:TolB protein